MRSRPPQIYISVSPLREVTDEQEYDRPAMPTPLAHKLFQRRFVVDWQVQVSLQTVCQGLDEADLKVLPGLLHHTGNIVVTDMPLVPLKDWCSRFPPEKEPGNGAHKRQETRKPKDATDDPPWYKDFFDRSRRKVDTALLPVVDASSDDSGDDDEDSVKSDTDDAAISSVFKMELEMARAAVAIANHEDDFKVGLVVATKEKRDLGEVYSDYQAFAVSALAIEFVRLRPSIFNTFKARICEHGEDTCALLCRSWVHKLNFYFLRAVAAGDLSVAFSSDDHRAYGEPTELTNLFNTVPASEVRLRGRILYIRTMFS